MQEKNKWSQPRPGTLKYSHTVNRGMHYHHLLKHSGRKDELFCIMFAQRNLLLQEAVLFFPSDCQVPSDEEKK